MWNFLILLGAMALVGVALTADRVTPKALGSGRSYPVKAGAKIYDGAIVAIELSSGYAVPASDTALLLVVGVAQAQADNTSGGNGAIDVEVEEGIFDLDAVNLAQSAVGLTHYVADDHTLRYGGTTNRSPAGMLVEFLSATRGRFLISPAAHSAVVNLQVLYSSPNTGEGAALVGVEDAGTYFATANVEAVLAEIATQLGGDTSVTFNFSEANVCADDDAVYAALEKLDLKFGDLASVATGEGAALIGIEDSTGYYTLADVEGALAELAAQISGDTSVTYNFTEANVLADDDGVYPALEKLDLKFGDLASAATGEGAALVGIEDAGAHFTVGESNVEAAIQALAASLMFTFPNFTGWTVDGGAHTVTGLPAIEFPHPIRIKRAYLGLGTAPGGGKTLALTVNGNALVSIAEAAVQAEAEALDIAIAADTDIVLAANETAGGAGANATLVIIYDLDDGV